MSWLRFHKASELKAVSAHGLRNRGDNDQAKAMFHSAAKDEVSAVLALGNDKPRTLAACAVSAIALFFKADEFQEAEQFAFQMLLRPDLSAPATAEIRDMVRAIWDESAMRKAHSDQI